MYKYKLNKKIQMLTFGLTGNAYYIDNWKKLGTYYI